MRGKFITLEGGEGTGKSTQAAMLALRLESQGLAVQLTREPGGSPGAEIIRHVLLTGAAKPLGADVEAMLFAAARDDPAGASIRQVGCLRPVCGFNPCVSRRSRPSRSEAHQRSRTCFSRRSDARPYGYPRFVG